ncbi:MAG: ABC transporter permease [Ruminococcus flavefaciens]|nr:ABC transporter permease [Ruminococcus flavefaciens]
MNRIKAFSARNIKEILREPLSYIFCLGFPLVMLVIMTFVNESIPAESGMTIFRIDNLYGGIAVFGQMFIMLFTAITVSKDRAGAFLVRMYATPMTTADFVLGYILPMTALSVVQNIITAVVSLIISVIAGVEISIAGILLSVIILIPSALMFIGFGLLFGSLFSDKSAPAMSSIIISLASFLGGIWFDAENAGGAMLKISKCLPFYYCTKTARLAIAMNFDNFAVPMITATACSVVVIMLSSLVFKAKMKADLS